MKIETIKDPEVAAQQFRRAPNFTDKQKDRYVELIRSGCSKTAAAAAVGIHPATINKHRNKFPEFNERVIEAVFVPTAKVERKLYQLAMEGNIQAIQTWLYNRAPQEWADKRTVHSKINAKIDVNHNVEAAQRIRSKIHQIIEQDAKFKPLIEGENSNDKSDETHQRQRPAQLELQGRSSETT